MVIITGIILPKGLNLKDSFINNDDQYEKEDSSLILIIGVLLTIPITALCNPYIFITVYSTNRRRYISGYFFYER